MTKLLVKLACVPMATVNIYEAKTQLSRLLKRARAGEEIVIADHGTPVAKLVPIDPPVTPRALGGDRGRVWMAPDAFEPSSEQELATWYDAPLVTPTAPGAAKRSRRRVTRKQPR